MDERVVPLGIAVEEQRGADLVVDPLLVMERERAVLEELRGLLEEEVIVDAVFRRVPDQPGQIFDQGHFPFPGEGQAEIVLAEPALAVGFVEVGQRDRRLRAPAAGGGS